jgi:hypothetical protein
MSVNVTSWAETVIGAIAAGPSDGQTDLAVLRSDVFVRLEALPGAGELPVAVSKMLELVRDAQLVEAGHSSVDFRTIYRLTASGLVASRRGIRVALDTDARRAGLSIPCIRFSDRFARMVCERVERDTYVLLHDLQVTDNDVFDTLEPDGGPNLDTQERRVAVSEAADTGLIRRAEPTSAGTIVRARLALFPVSGH